MADDPSPDEARNGWTAESLARYRAEREAASDWVPGNVVTEYKRPKPAVVIENCKRFNPHKW